MLLVQRDDFRSVSQDAPVQLTLLGILDAMCGLVEARKSEHFQFLLPFLQVCVSLMNVYSGVAEVITVILKLFSLVAEYFVVWFESNVVSAVLYYNSFIVLLMDGHCLSFAAKCGTAAL
jgi:hypothetical protein